MSDIVFVIVRGTDAPEVYGGEKSSIATAVAMRRLGHNPSFVTTADDAFTDELAAAGLSYTVVPVGDPFSGFGASGLVGRARRLADMARISAAVFNRARGRARSSGDGGAIVHTAAIPGFVTGWLGGLLARAPVIFHVRTASMKQKVRHREEVAMLLARRTITVSGSLRDQLLTTGWRFTRRLVGNRVQAIYNGFDFSEMDAAIAAEPASAARAAVGPDPGRPSALLVGAVFRDKGQLAFIERVLPAVVARVPALHVTFAGGIKDPAYHRACLDAIARLGLARNVDFVGYQPKARLYRHYRAADFLILPSEREGLPRCVVEGHAFALPVVATAVVGTVEAARDQETGFLVPLERLEDMIDPIVRLATDAALRERMGAAGAAHVRCTFDLAENVRAIAAVYRELAPKV